MRAVIVYAGLPQDSGVIRELADRVDLTVVASSWTPHGQYHAPPFVADVHICLLEPAYRSPRGHLWWWYRGFQQVVRRRTPHIVHVLSEPWGLLVTQALHNHRSEVVAHTCDPLWRHGQYLEDAIRLSVARRNVRRLAGLAAENQQAIDRAHQNGLRSSAPVDLIHTSPRSADTFDLVGAHNQAKLRREWGLRPEIPVIGMCGRLVEAKGVRVLLDAYRRLGVWGVPASLLIAGNGPLENHVREFASQYDDVVIQYPLVHNRYRTSGGEERHVDLLAEVATRGPASTSLASNSRVLRITHVRDRAQAQRRLRLPPPLGRRVHRCRARS